MCDKKPISLGLIGLGDHMFRRLYPRMAGLPVRLTAVCDINIDRITRFQTMYQTDRVYTDFYEMLDQEQLDAVICAGSPLLHYEAAKACMQRGISPFVEKTPCLTYGQARELKALEEQTGCFTMVGFNRRFTTSYEMAKEIINREEFGGASLYMAKYHSSLYPTDEYFLLNHVIHHLDLARYLMGEIRDISGRKIVRGEQKVGYHIAFTTCNGALGFIETSSLQQEEYPAERVEITGDGCNVIVDNVKRLEYNRPPSRKCGKTPLLSDRGDMLCWNYNHGHSSLYGHYGFERELECYIDAVMGNGGRRAHLHEIAETMELYEKLRDTCLEIAFRKGGALDV